MKKMPIVVLSLVLIFIIANVAMVVNNQQKDIALVVRREAEIVEQTEEIRHSIQTIKDQLNELQEMQDNIRHIAESQRNLIEEIEDQKEKIEALESQISQYIESTPFEKLKITGIQNSSQLKQDKEFSKEIFRGTISLGWDAIPNASGYEIEFNYSPILERTTNPYYCRTGGFHSQKVDISEGLKFRIRAYNQQDGEEVYGEFSEWTSLEVE